MPETKTIILLSKIMSQSEKKGITKTYIDIILEEDIPIVCINKTEKKKKLMPFRVMYDNNKRFWEQAGKWEYYFSEEDYEKLKEKIAIKPQAYKKSDAEFGPGIEESESTAGYGSDYKTFAEMSIVEKVNYLNKNKQRLNDLIVQKPKNIENITQALVDTTKGAALINQTTLEKTIGLEDDEAKKITQDVVETTREMVKSSVYLIKEDVFNNELMHTLVEKSNGTIVQHMTRVYLNGVAFLSYYNKLVSTSSTIQKIRLSFASRYRNFYKTLMPHIAEENLTLERVFLGGMRAVPLELVLKWAIGFLVHDIGKVSSVEYHEGESKYDRNIVVEHVKIGYKYIMNKTNYPLEASFITGYHHEYYGDPGGYGYFRTYLQQHKKQNPSAKLDYCIAYELEPILDYQAIAYFPAKVLEIIDVYDSVTDPLRVYRKALTSEEALAMMRKQFIVDNQKIDPVIFDIYCLFIREQENRKKIQNLPARKMAGMAGEELDTEQKKSPSY
ncbi:MAG: hypothetical protein FWG92_00475 [Leptospirales bacterium]|nr:hypothetical protein [Leptospirales bacterium]